MEERQVVRCANKLCGTHVPTACRLQPSNHVRGWTSREMRRFAGHQRQPFQQMAQSGTILHISHLGVVRYSACRKACRSSRFSLGEATIAAGLSRACHCNTSLWHNRAWSQTGQERIVQEFTKVASGHVKTKRMEEQDMGVSRNQVEIHVQLCTEPVDEVSMLTLYFKVE
jgi:hypothetical protein